MEKFGKTAVFPGGFGWIGEIPHGRIWPDWGLYGIARNGYRVSEKQVFDWMVMACNGLLNRENCPLIHCIYKKKKEFSLTKELHPLSHSDIFS